MSSKSKVSPAIFAASILSFLLPFITVSCGGQRVASFSGVQLATGTSVEQPQIFGPPKKQKVEPDPTAAVAGICALLGLGLSFLGAKNAIAPAVSGAIGVVTLFLMKVRLDDQIVKQGQGMLQVNYETGYVLAIALLIAGAGWNAFLISQQKREPLISAPASPLDQRPVAINIAACPNCGTETSLGAHFCKNCGRPVTDLTGTCNV